MNDESWLVFYFFFTWRKFRIVISIMILMSIGSNVKANTESDIYKKLLDNASITYYKEIRPQPFSKKRQLPVKFDMTIQNVGSLDVKTQVLRLNVFTFIDVCCRRADMFFASILWNDQRLTWNASEFNDIDSLITANTDVWTPDIMLYNSARDETLSHTALYRSKVSIGSDGEIVWINPVTYSATCQVDVTWFPFDFQICNLTFGSWSYSAVDLDIKFKDKKKTTDNIKTGFHVPNGEWEINTIKFFEEDTYFECCKRPFSTITFQIKLSRYPDFYNLYVFLPFISQLALFLLIFNIQPEQGDRLGYGVALLLNMTMYMIFISDKLPEKSDKVPFVGTVFVTFFFCLSLGLILSAYTMSCSLRTTPLPAVAYRIGNLVTKITSLCCFMTRTKGSKESNRRSTQQHGEYNLNSASSAFRHQRSFSDEQKNTLKETVLIEKADTTDVYDPTTATANMNNVVTPMFNSVPSAMFCGGGSIDDNNADASGDTTFRFKNWFQFMRFVEKCLTVLFVFLLILIPLVIAASLDTKRKA